MLVFPNVQIVKIILIDLVSGFTMCISSDLKWTHLNESFSFQKGLVGVLRSCETFLYNLHTLCFRQPRKRFLISFWRKTLCIRWCEAFRCKSGGVLCSQVMLFYYFTVFESHLKSLIFTKKNTTFLTL